MDIMPTLTKEPTMPTTMSRSRAVLSTIGTLVALTAFTSIVGAEACSTGEVPVGAVSQSGQALQKKSDGTATGNGIVCSWDGTAYADNAAKAGASDYGVGATFKSFDGCNDCSCTAQGIMCTIRLCPQACPDLAKQCPDGSYVSPTGPNCDYPACPPVKCPPNPCDGTPVPNVPGCPAADCPPPPPPTPCPALAKICPDGSSVSATGPNCEFPACPPTPTPGPCPDLAKQCPDGSTVTASGPNCTIPECPCAKSECGPQLGMPNYVCPDGKTVAGPGPCVRTNGVCGYTIVSCPAN
jgi:hypothetical protein